jgi:enoyl-CoA hydratase
MDDSALRYSLRGAVARLDFDDGKANVVSHAVLDAFGRALDRAEKESGSALLVGRPGCFCAGFDLNVMQQGPEAAQELVAAGAELLLRMAEAPLPIVTACSGHALAMGALLLLASDSRIGSEGDFKIGLNEVGRGMTLPRFAAALARERLSRAHLGRAAVHAEIYAPPDAVVAGFLDRVVPAGALEQEAAAEAARLAELPRRAFAETKRAVRGTGVERLRAGLAADVAAFRGESPPAPPPPDGPQRR